MSLRLLNEKGFSLPEVMIAVGLLGGLSLVTMKLVENQANNENNIKATTEISKALSVIQTNINNENNCKDMLSGITRSGSVDVGTPVPELSILLKDGSRKVFLKANENYGSFVIRTGDIQLASSEFSSGSVADLIINFKVKKGHKASVSELNNPALDARNYSVVRKRIPIVVTLDSSNRVRSCGPVVSDANDAAREKFCNSLGSGTAEWIDNKCKLKSMDCPYGQLPHRMTSLGGTICKPAEDVIDPGTIFDTTPCTGTQFRVEYISGKLRMKCL